MPNSGPSSAASATCRIEWRPSRRLCAILVLLSLLAAAAVLTSEMPRPAAWPLALAALGHGLRLAWRHARSAPRSFLFAGDRAPVLLDGERIEGVQVAWRGPLAFVAWRDGRGRTLRLAWWPDTLGPRQRRELRLAAPVRPAARWGRSVAP